MTNSLIAAQQVVAMGSGPTVIVGLIELVIFVVLLVDIWRTNASTGTKVGWTIFSFLCGIIALIVWLVWGKKKYSGGITA